MATFPQSQDGRLEPVTWASEPSGAMSPVPNLPELQGLVDLGAWDSAGTLVDVDAKTPPGGEAFVGERAFFSTVGVDWFEDFHVLPRSFNFGNLLSDQSTPIEVFSGFRRETKEWTSLVNNAGAGTSLGGQPVLPTLVGPLEGIAMTLDVSATGDPFVDGYLVFVFDGVGEIVVPVEVQRIVLWGLEPELPFSEVLGFLTDVKLAKSGKEKRYRARRWPRQSWLYEYVIEEGAQAQQLENRLFDYQARTFGVPVWFDDTTMPAAVSAGATSVAVVETAWRDFRVGGLAVVFTSMDTFDVLEVAAVNPTSIDFASPTVNAYAAGTLVYPLSPCRILAAVSGERYAFGLRRVQIRFESVENAVDLGDLSPFSTYDGKLLLDLGNSLAGRATVGHDFRQQVVQLDGGAGQVFQEGLWDRHKRGHLLTVRADGRQAVWELRNLVRGLHGRQVSFYVPTDSDDLQVSANLLNAGTTMSVDAVGYAQFVRHRQPKDVIRLNFADGSPALLRRVTDSTQSSPTVDTLTVDVPWPATITPAELSRVEFVEKLRFDTDDVRLEFDASGHRARLSVPVVAVFE